MWQPIKTAPKDGTQLLLWGSWHDSIPDRCWVGGWETSYSEREIPVGNGLYRKGRVESWTGQDFHPTHWMPLPAPPSEVSAIQEAREEAEETSDGR